MTSVQKISLQRKQHFTEKSEGPSGPQETPKLPLNRFNQI